MRGQRWTSGLAIAVLTCIDLLAALFLVVNTAVSSWVLVPFGLLVGLSLAWIAQRSLVGATAVGLLLAFVLFMVGFAAGTGALSGL